MGAIGRFFRGVFSFTGSRSSQEERFAAYVIREHDRGRSLEEILNDRYLLNRTTPAQRARLLELYLARTLGLHVDDVHDEADRLEHVLSEELESKIDSALGYPTHDPHGDPIPNAKLEWPK